MWNSLYVSAVKLVSSSMLGSLSLVIFKATERATMPRSWNFVFDSLYLFKNRSIKFTVKGSAGWFLLEMSCFGVKTVI